jgi:hypothetical protein
LAVVELLDRLTTTPPDGAATARVAFPVVDDPPTTVVGLTVMELRPAGLTMIVVLTSPPFSAAEIVMEVLLDTAPAEPLKLTDVAPAGTVTAPGMDRILPPLLVRSTSAPPLRAGASRVTVPVNEEFAPIDVGLTTMLFTTEPFT